MQQGGLAAPLVAAAEEDYLDLLRGEPRQLRLLYPAGERGENLSSRAEGGAAACRDAEAAAEPDNGHAKAACGARRGQLQRSVKLRGGEDIPRHLQTAPQAEPRVALHRGGGASAEKNPLLARRHHRHLCVRAAEIQQHGLSVTRHKYSSPQILSYPYHYRS